MSRIAMGDPHINEKSIPELKKIFEEICKVPGEELIMLGDYYDKKHPTAQEILFGTHWANQFKQTFKKVTFIRGNHEKTKDISAVDYLKYIGISVVDSYTDRCNNHYAHYMLYESRLEYGTGKCGVKDLKQYKKVFLGHQHTFQKLAKNIFHVGSVRYVNFNEVEDKNKVIALLDEANKVVFASLKSPMPMIEVKSIMELPNIKTGKKKIRLVISSFDQFKKEVNEFDKYRHKFFEFKVKLDFNQRKGTPNVDKKSVIYAKRNLEDILKEGIKEIEDEDVRTLLEKQLEEIK